ncbi:MAG TPA: hypothetical protein VHE33_07145 [Acidobacteriaceae bacterium]|nr:hypothetical protein [Acidobacteriaceae bacterium]
MVIERTESEGVFCLLWGEPGIRDGRVFRFLEARWMKAQGTKGFREGDHAQGRVDIVVL